MGSSNATEVKQITATELVNDYPEIYKEYIINVYRTDLEYYYKDDSNGDNSKNEVFLDKSKESYAKHLRKKYGLVLIKESDPVKQSINNSIIEDQEKFASVAPKTWCDYKYKNLSSGYYSWIEKPIFQLADHSSLRSIHHISVYKFALEKELGAMEEYLKIFIKIHCHSSNKLSSKSKKRYAKQLREMESVKINKLPNVCKKAIIIRFRDMNLDENDYELAYDVERLLDIIDKHKLNKESSGESSERSSGKSNTFSSEESSEESSSSS